MSWQAGRTYPHPSLRCCTQKGWGRGDTFFFQISHFFSLIPNSIKRIYRLPCVLPKICLCSISVFFHEVFMSVYLQGLAIHWMVWTASRLWRALHVQLLWLNASLLLKFQNWLSTKCWLKCWMFYQGVYKVLVLRTERKRDVWGCE